MCVIGNPYEFNEAQKLLKQMEVEQMNHMSNDQIKKRVGGLPIVMAIAAYVSDNAIG